MTTDCSGRLLSLFQAEHTGDNNIKIGKSTVQGFSNMHYLPTMIMFAPPGKEASQNVKLCTHSAW